MMTDTSFRSRPRQDAAAMPSPLVKRSGFTLVEAMVAMVIIGITLTGVFGAMARSFDLIEASRDHTRVAQIIQSELEDLRTLSWSELEAMYDGGAGAWLSYTPSTSFAAEFGNKYTCYRFIFPRGADQYGIRVYVGWTDSNGDWKFDSFETWYTEGGFNDYYYRSF